MESYVAARYAEASLFNAEITLEHRLAARAVFSARIGDLRKAFFLLQLGSDHWTLTRLEACSETVEKEVIPLTQRASTKDLIAVSLSLPHISSTFSRIALLDSAGSIAQELYAFNGGVHAEAWSPSGTRLVYAIYGEGPHVFRVASFREGKDDLVREVPGFDFFGIPTWLDDDLLIGADAEGLLLFPVGGSPSRLMTSRELGVCTTRIGKCPNAYGIAVAPNGSIAVTFGSGHLAVFSNGVRGPYRITRTPDGSSCGRPFFRPQGDRVGLTCANYQTGAPADFNATTDVNAWVVDLENLQWFKIATSKVSFESSASYFPWTPDSTSYMVEGSGESPCSPSFQFFRATGGASTPDIWGSFGSFAPNGQSFLYQGLDDYCEAEGSGIFQSSLDGQVRRRILTEGRGPLWSPAR